MSVKKYIRKNIYRWHRLASLLVAIPVLLWTVSGFLHPVMNSFKPEVRNQYLPVTAIDTSKTRLSLQKALQQHNIASIRNFRIVELYGAHYFQVQHLDKDTLTYISCYNGQLLLQGDQQYAAYTAQLYLSEPNKQEKKNDHHGAAADLSNAAMRPMAMSSHQKTNITDVSLVKEFTGEYKKSNVLLPVYRVQFDRGDNTRLYIETSTGHLATAVNDTKAWFTKFFAVTHSWSFLNGLGLGKNILLGSFSLLCFLTSLFGFYVYNITKNKKNKTRSATVNRSLHRTLGNIFVFTTLLYSFSGAWHSFHKLSGKDESIYYDRSQFSTSELDLSLVAIIKNLQAGETLTNISVVKIENKNYWQVYVSKGKEKQKKYLDTKTLKELNDGDNKYGCYLACLFANKPHHSITHSKCLTQFNDRYSMMNKRLPVIEVGFDEKNYYVETATGKLSAITGAVDKAERFSFSNLHMHHYWEMWLGKEKGKPVKNLVLISSTLGLLLLALTGILLYWRKFMKKRKTTASI